MSHWAEKEDDETVDVDLHHSAYQSQSVTKSTDKIPIVYFISFVVLVTCTL